MTYILEEGTQLDITQEQRDRLVSKELIHYCDECHCYHIEPDVLLDGDFLTDEGMAQVWERIEREAQL